MNLIEIKINLLSGKQNLKNEYMTTIFDLFDNILEEAEREFYRHRFEQALEKWQSYYQITAKVEYNLIIKEIKKLVKEINPAKIISLSDLHRCFRLLRQRYLEKQIHPYTYRIFTKLLTDLYEKEFKTHAEEDDLATHAIFLYLEGDLEKAKRLLERYLKKDTENMEARVFEGHIYLKQGEQKKAIAVLTKNLFLAADQLYEDDLYLSQFKMLYGRLHSEYGRKDVALWLLAFEAWFRNYLVFEQDEGFYKIMLRKEQNERIIRVKYTLAEKYRHFVRCLYISEYSRLFIKTNKGMINEIETYMEQLDVALFTRYRKKRKPLKMN